MKSLVFLAVSASLLVACCQPKPDTEAKAEDASKKAREAMQGVGKVVDTATAATVLTPRLKSAITANKELNDRRNLINVDSNDTTVTLDGWVHAGILKTKAEEIVKAEMSKAGAKQMVVNNLEVRQVRG